MDDRLQGKYVHIKMLRGTGFDTIEGKVVDESPLYYVVQCADNCERLMFKTAIRYITIYESENEVE